MTSPPQSIAELLVWMDEQGYRKDAYAIGGRDPMDSTYGIQKTAHGYDWYFSERGGYELIKTFPDEPSVVAHAFAEISKDLTGKTHCVGFLDNRADLLALTTELRYLKIAFEIDEIPFNGPDDPRWRVFVIGTDIFKVRHLQERYGSVC